MDTTRTDSGGRRWAMLALLSLAELLGMSLWFTASAVAPQLEARWALDAVQAGWLTTTVQLGFVAGTAFAAILNLADILPARRYMALSALAGALANASLLVAPGFGVALVGRFLVGFFLAGVYPPAMKMVATWFRSARGMAIGTVVGALTVGKATPYLVSAFHTAGLGFVVLTGSAGAVVAAALVEFGYHDGPFPFERRPFDWKLVGRVLGHRPSRLAIGGYLGHMWELYAMWALVSHFFMTYFAARGAPDAHAVVLSGLVGFGAIAMGGPGSVIAGTWADRWGRERVASAAMMASGAIALVIGWLTFLPPAVLVALALVWGFFVVADSAQFSALVTEVTPRHAVGTGLTLQTSLGFGLTAFSIWLTVEVSSRVGWGPAFSMLAVGPVLGIWAMGRLRKARG
jgi:MFS family permease